MPDPIPSIAGGASLRIELFPEDLDVFVDFYTRVLGFTLVADRRDTENPYVAVARDTIRIGAVRPQTPVDPRTRTVPNGVEVVLEVDDLDQAYRRVTDCAWPLVEDLKVRPWGLTDFRLHDPDGYFLRITNRLSF
jgi:lactoylglutathione lyase